MSIGILLAHITFALLLFLVVPSKNVAWQGRLILLVLAGAASFVAIDGLSLGDYMRSYTDDLAVTTLLILLWSGLSRLRGTHSLSRPHKNHMALCFTVMAVFLYPATLGMSTIDPYRLGYSPAPLLVSMAAVCLWLWWLGNHVTLGVIALATGAFLLGVKHSDNYWDYLIDPLLGVYSLGYLIAQLFRTGWPKFIPVREVSGEM